MLLGLAPREVIPAEGVGAKFLLFFQFSPRSSETQRPFPNVPQYILVGLDGSSATTWGSLPCSSSAACHFPAECSKIARASPITTKIFDISFLNLSGPRRCNQRPWSFRGLQDREIRYSRSDAPLQLHSCGAKKRWESRSYSWVHIRAVSEIETDRLHHLESGALREDVCGGELAGVLFDHRLRCGPRYLV